MMESRIYVGNLPMDVHERDIEDLFFKYGKIREIELKVRGAVPYAFVQFDDPRDAEEAIYGRNGYEYGGCNLRVAFTKAPGKQSGLLRRSGLPSWRSEFRVIVSGLPRSGSWQDLKDHMREAGDVCFSHVNGDGTGIVGFLRKKDMKFAIERLDRTSFRSHEGEMSLIRVFVDRGPPPNWGRLCSSSRSRGRYSPPYNSHSSPPPRYQSPPRHFMSRHSPSPPRRHRPSHYSPPPPRYYR
ncbi:serine/arginine-rich splicing factor 9-like isoform 1-T2 [Pholidichthys leucotaenia]